MEGYLHLESGHSFKGQWLIEPTEQNLVSEIVIFTGMTGYQEVLIDPSYKDQVVVFTYPLIGNYGINEAINKKKPLVAGVIAYEVNDTPSHYQSSFSFKEYLQQWDIPLLGHIDTRGLVKKVRVKDTVAAILSTSEEEERFCLCPKTPVFSQS